MAMRLRTPGLIVTLALGILSAPLAADAQPAGKVYRIGYLGSAPPTTPDVARNTNAFLRGMRDLGYVEGQNLRIEWRYAEGRAERHPGFAAELVGLKVDVIVAVVTPAVQAAKGRPRRSPLS